MKLFRLLLTKFQNRLARTSSKRYIAFLKAKGVLIGDNFTISASGRLRDITIDLTRPSLISIGDNVTINQNFTLLTHDFVSGIFLHKYHEFIPSSGSVKIGNNVRFGVNCTVLKNVEIGDNVFIGAGSVVTKNIPSNSLAAGVPCKVICSIDDYYERRKKESILEAMNYARSIKERFNRKPVVTDFWEEFPLFCDKENVDNYAEIPIRKQLQNEYSFWLENHKAQFRSFEDFLVASGL